MSPRHPCAVTKGQSVAAHAVMTLSQTRLWCCAQPAMSPYMAIPGTRRTADVRGVAVHATDGPFRRTLRVTWIRPSRSQGSARGATFPTMTTSILLDQYRAFSRYNRWMNQRIYAVVAGLDPTDRTRDLGAFFRSVHGTLNHLLLADRLWMRRLTGDPVYVSHDAEGAEIPFRGLDQELYSDFGALTRERTATDDHIVEWTRTVTEPTLAAPLRYHNTRGGSMEHPTWWALSQLFNHGTHHRGQVTTLLKQLGRDPGATDFGAFIFSENPHPGV